MRHWKQIVSVLCLVCMTLLLTMEAIDSGRIALDDMVTVSAYAAAHAGCRIEQQGRSPRISHPQG